MHAAVRAIDTYCPIADIAQRHPGWTVHLIAELPPDAGEIFLPQRRRLLLSKEKHDQDPALVLAHAIAHIDLHRIGGPFTAAQEEEATMLALVRLDRESDRWPDVDGDPTVTRA